MPACWRFAYASASTTPDPEPGPWHAPQKLLEAGEQRSSALTTAQPSRSLGSLQVRGPRGLVRDRPSRPAGVGLRSLEGRADSSSAPLTFPVPSSERQEFLCSVIGLSVKLGLGLLAAVSLTHLASAYQQRLDRHSELSAILDIETARLRRAQTRFDKLFALEGEQQMMREQDQWIAPNRLRVVWEEPRQSRSLQSRL